MKDRKVIKQLFQFIDDLCILSTSEWFPWATEVAKDLKLPRREIKTYQIGVEVKKSDFGRNLGRDEISFCQHSNSNPQG